MWKWIIGGGVVLVVGYLVVSHFKGGSSGPGTGSFLGGMGGSSAVGQYGGGGLHDPAGDTPKGG